MSSYWLWKAPELEARQGNPTLVVRQLTIKRGLIFGSDGRSILARNKNKEVAGRTWYLRTYPRAGSPRRLVGYSTIERSRTGLEKSLNDYLTGSNANLTTLVDRALDTLTGSTREGNDVVTSLDLDAQTVAMSSWRRRCGSVVAIEPDDRPRARLRLDAHVRPEPGRGRTSRASSTRTGPASPPRRSSTARRRACRGPCSSRAPPSRSSPPRRRSTPAASRRRARSTIPATASSTATRSRTTPTSPARTSSDRWTSARRAELDQLGLLQHRQGARPPDRARLRQALRLLRGSAARDARRRAHAQRPLVEGPPLRPRGSEPGRPWTARLRPGAAARDAAPDGHGGRDDRERRRPHGAARRATASSGRTAT